MTAGDTPFEIVTSARSTRRGTKDLMLALSREIEHQAEAMGATAVLIATFQDDARLTTRVRRRYAELGAKLAFVGALGAGVGRVPTPGVRGADLAASDPLRGEWDIAVVGPHFACALVARDLGDPGPDRDRRLDFAITYHRDLVLACTRSLLERVAPSPGSATPPA